MDVELRGLESSAPLPQSRHSYQDILQPMFSMNGSDPVLDKLDQPKNILHFKYMWYIAPLNVVIQQR